MTITLEPFHQSHLPLLAAWLASPQVARWYPHPANDMSMATNPPERGSHALIANSGVPIGYIRWQYVDRETLDSVGLTEIPAGSVDIDLLIGVPSRIGCGIGPIALDLLASKLMAESSNIPMLGLTTSIHNVRAHKAFSKAGYSKLLVYEPKGFGPCHLMIRDIRGTQLLR